MKAWCTQIQVFHKKFQFQGKRGRENAHAKPQVQLLNFCFSNGVWLIWCFQVQNAKFHFTSPPPFLAMSNLRHLVSKVWIKYCETIIKGILTFKTNVLDRIRRRVWYVCATRCWLQDPHFHVTVAQTPLDKYFGIRGSYCCLIAYFLYPHAHCAILKSTIVEFALLHWEQYFAGTICSKSHSILCTRGDRPFDQVFTQIHGRFVTCLQRITINFTLEIILWHQQKKEFTCSK